MSNPIKLSKKIIMVGDPSVGKTSMIRKFVYDMFDDKYIATLGTKVTSKQIECNHPQEGTPIELKLMIWDVMGQKDYEMFHQSAYMGSQGALVVCDITRRETMDNLTNWISGLFNVTGQIPIVFIGNKSDLISQQQFDLDDLSQMASTFEVPSFLTSAKTGDNVDVAFNLLGENIVKSDYS